MRPQRLYQSDDPASESMFVFKEVSPLERIPPETANEMLRKRVRMHYSDAFGYRPSDSRTQTPTTFESAKIENVATFKALGGSIAMCKDGDPKVVDLYYTDRVFPVCAEGKNRSQVARLVLAELFTKNKPPKNTTSRIAMAHGVTGGFDTQNEDSLQSLSTFVSPSMMVSESAEDSSFFAAFGRYREDRVGQAEAVAKGFMDPSAPTKSKIYAGLEMAALIIRDDKEYLKQLPQIRRERDAMRDLFTATYFNPEALFRFSRTNRVVFIVFTEHAAGIIVNRLIEGALASESSLLGVYVVVMPLNDTVATGPMEFYSAVRGKLRMHSTRCTTCGEWVEDDSSRCARGHEQEVREACKKCGLVGEPLTDGMCEACHDWHAYSGAGGGGGSAGGVARAYHVRRPFVATRRPQYSTGGRARAANGRFLKQ